MRTFIQCENCAHIYMFRLGEPPEDKFIYQYDCIECKLPLVIAVLANEMGIYKINPEENVIILKHDPKDYTVVNMLASFPLKKDQVHDEKASPSLEAMNYVIEKGDFRLNQDSKFQSYADQFELRNSVKAWGIIKAMINCKRNSKDCRSQYNKLNEIRSSNNKKYSCAHNDKKAIYDFFDAMFYPKFTDKYNESIILLSEANKNLTGFVDLKEYYLETLYNDNLTRYVDIFTEFFKNYYQFCQLLLFSRIEDKEVDIDGFIVSSKNFSEIKAFYERAYETLSKNSSLLVFINNLLIRGDFKLFEEWSLDNYNNAETKNRLDLMRNLLAGFSALSDSLDNELRNGCAHSDIAHNIDETITYKHSKKEQNITYAKYLFLCNNLVINIAVMFCLFINIFGLRQRIGK